MTQTHFYFKKIKINDIDWVGIQNLVEKIITAKERAYFCMTDAGNVIMAQKDAQLALSINQADLSIADGTPLAWFGKLTGWKRIQRISGPDIFQRLLHHTNFKHFLLGDTVAMHNKIIKKVKGIKPDVQIESFSPPFKTKFSETDNQLIMDKIQTKQPDIIWVSFGGGKQEKWMFENLANLGHGIMIGVD
jgi:N-acetylglucosaminyldiphosphoundecaprenol N-acetyl-beta-D-mannosaminyltransferase